MDVLQAILLGILQGITEFLPISSSAHVKIAKLFFHIDPSESQVVFDLICHLGTLGALLFFMKKEIRDLIQIQRNKLPLFLIALLPLPPLYFLLKPIRDWASSSHYLGFCLMVTALILFLSGKIRFPLPSAATRKGEVHSSLWIGIMQSLALIPGISRSASTIGCARVLGWEMREAVRFSFLLSIPTIIGGNCLELLKLSLAHTPCVSLSPLSCIAGFLASFSSGLVVIKWALSYLEKGNLKPFAWYCLFLGIAISLYTHLFL